MLLSRRVAPDDPSDGSDSRVRMGGGDVGNLQQQVALLREQLGRLQGEFRSLGSHMAQLSEVGQPSLHTPRLFSVETERGAATKIQSVQRGKEARDRFKAVITVSKEFHSGEVAKVQEASKKAHTDSATHIMADDKHGGTAAKIFLFLGGLYEFPGRPWAKRAYEACWLVALASCGAACWANLRYRQVPSHNVPTDLITAYAHLPAMQGWLFWRVRVDCPMFQSVVETLRLATDEDRALFALRVKWISRAVLATCCSMTALVLCAYALPIRIENGRELLGSEAKPHGSDLPRASYMWWHEMIMWAAILPVIFSLLTSYSMFVFFCMLHRLDFKTTARKMAANVPLLLDEKAAGVDTLKRSARFVASCESVALAAQRRLDYTCSQWSALGLHLLMFSTCQIMVVCTNIESYTIGPGWGSGEDYHWWWILQDLFHGVGGLVLNAIYFIFMTHVTRGCEEAVTNLSEALKERSASPAVRSQTAALLTATVSGAHVFGIAFNDESSVAFIWALVCTLWASSVAILCDRVYWRDMGRVAVEAASCDCLAMFDQGEHLVAGGISFSYAEVDAAFVYPYNYGLVSCAAHDYALPPYCNGSAVSQVEDWCTARWCYVDETCGAEKFESAVFAGISYSYEACEESVSGSAGRRSHTSSARAGTTGRR